jgi:hypothetical protein
VSRHRGSLTAVGLGISAPAQTTLETKTCIERAEKVFSLVADPLAEYWLRTLNPNTESLGVLYAVGKERSDTYREMVERILEAVRENVRVCAAAYGHPGVAAYPLHESVRRARAEGFDARMYAGVSAEDCLFADLGIDPVAGGYRSYEATDFLIYRRIPDTTCNLVLWQIGAIAEPGFKRQHSAWNPEGLVVLTDRLLVDYDSTHEVIVYEAAQMPACKPRAEAIALARLSDARITPMSTLFVPPMTAPKADREMLQRLGIRSREAAASARAK